MRHNVIKRAKLARETERWRVEKWLREINDGRILREFTAELQQVPTAGLLPIMVENAVASVAGVGEVKVNIVWDPPWDPSRMSDEARAVLNMW